MNPRCIDSLILASTVLIASACGDAAAPPVTAVQALSPEDEVLNVSARWEATLVEKGLQSEPSLISVFQTRQLSQLSFEPGSEVAHELVAREETFRLRDGRSFVCRVEQLVSVKVRFARRGEEPAVEVSRPGLRFLRQCDNPNFPEPELEVPAQRARFVLRNEHLTGYDPPLEKRNFRPVQ